MKQLMILIAKKMVKLHKQVLVDNKKHWKVQKFLQNSLLMKMLKKIKIKKIKVENRNKQKNKNQKTLYNENVKNQKKQRSNMQKC